MTRLREQIVLLEVINPSSLTRFRKRRWPQIEQDLGSTGISYTIEATSATTLASDGKVIFVEMDVLGLALEPHIGIEAKPQIPRSRRNAVDDSLQRG